MGSRQSLQADTPPVSDNNYIFVCASFEKFWQLYPNKQCKQKAFEAFLDLSPSENLFQKIITGLTAQCLYRKTLQHMGNGFQIGKTQITG